MPTCALVPGTTRQVPAPVSTNWPPSGSAPVGRSSGNLPSPGGAPMTPALAAGGLSRPNPGSPAAGAGSGPVRIASTTTMSVTANNTGSAYARQP